MDQLKNQTAQHYVVVANPLQESLDHALARAYAEEVQAQGQRCRICDLNAIAFDPVLKRHEKWGTRQATLDPWIDAELNRLGESAAIVLVYPIWFGGPPAILKGYIDRVFGAHCDVRKFADGNGQPALCGKWLLSISTSGTSLGWLQSHGQLQALRQSFDVYLERGFGMRDQGHIYIDNVVPNLSRAFVDAQLERAREAARHLCGSIIGAERVRTGVALPAFAEGE